MSILDDLKEIIPPRFHRDVALVAVAGIGVWQFFSFSGRLDAAEAHANTIAAVQTELAKVENDQAAMKQQVADTSDNVKALVAAIISPAAVVSHQAPKPHQ